MYMYNATKCLFITLGFFKLVNMYHLKANLHFYLSADIEIRGPHRKLKMGSSYNEKSAKFTISTILLLGPKFGAV